MALTSPRTESIFALPPDWTTSSTAFTGGFIALLAFIGFEEIENMAQETRDTSQNVPLAIMLTLEISVAIYALIAIVAYAWPDRAVLTASPAPLVDLFSGVTGLSGTRIAIMAYVIIINGILVQLVVASRVIYGMSNEKMLPPFLGKQHPRRKTPVRRALTATELLLDLISDRERGIYSFRPT